MPKIEIRDDCLAPARFVYMHYSGKNPFGVSKMIMKRLQTFFKVSTAGVFETDFRWDTSGGENISFFFEYKVKKNFSGYTTMWIHFKVQGKKNRETNEGNFSLQMWGHNITNFKYGSRLLKGLWWLYNFLFYFKRRADYLKQCRDFVYDFRNEIKEHYNLAVLKEEEA